MKSMNTLKVFSLASASAVAVTAATAQQIDPAAFEALQKQVKALTEELERLKEGPARMKGADDWMKRDLLKARGLSIGFYGESKYRFPESGANAFDAHRYVLTPSYQINDWLVFNSEIEFEHGGIDETAGAPGFTAASTTNNAAGRSRFDGEIEVEQFYVDVLINKHFNVRSLGIDLVPVGRINKFHEPTTFYSTERPELYREIIPSTWMEPGVGAFGKITDTLDYQFMVSSGLEDNVSNGTAGVTAANGIRNARPRLRRAAENSLAYSGRLHYTGIPGLDASSSFYVSRVRGFAEQRATLALADIEFSYRVPRTGLELRGDFAYWHIDKPGHLMANNNTSLTDDVGQQMYGWYAEAAYHFWPESWKKGRCAEMDFVPFVRYSDIVTQSRLPAGSTKLGNGTVNKDFITAGFSWFLNPNFVLKADWRRNLHGSVATENSDASQDYVQIGAGVFF